MKKWVYAFLWTLLGIELVSIIYPTILWGGFALENVTIPIYTPMITLVTLIAGTLVGRFAKKLKFWRAIGIGLIGGLVIMLVFLQSPNLF